MTAVWTWLANFAANFLYRKLIEGIKYLVEYFREKGKRKDIMDDGMERARSVEEISAQIKELVKQDKPVPAELINELREAQRRLLNFSLD